MILVITLAMLTEFSNMVDRIGLDHAVFTAKVNQGEEFANQMRTEYLAMLDRRAAYLNSIEVADPLAPLQHLTWEDLGITA
jgi:3-hydroxyisobutyrate dehydrogenase-like beta-hydroxyacid dehydrogenase